MADLDRDGRLDLLVGDGATIVTPAKGVKEDEIKGLLDSWEKKQQKLSEKMMQLQTALDKDPDLKTSEGKSAQKESEALDEAYYQAWEERNKIVKEERTGFVWVLYQK